MTGDGRRAGGAVVAVVAVVVVFFAAAMPLVWSGFDRGRGAFDQLNYHEPAVLRFAEELPRPDVSNYLSATTPLYHVLLALAARAGLDSPAVLQTLGSLFTAGLLGAAVWFVARRAGALVGAAAGLSIGASVYVFSAGVWMLPDNAAWLCVLGLLWLGVRARVRPATLVAAGAVLLALVLFRQVHIWAAAIVWAWGWVGSVPDDGPDEVGRVEDTSEETQPARLGHQEGRAQPGRLWHPEGVGIGGVGLWSSWRRRAAGLVLAGVATLPAFAAVGWFAKVWGGLTPPIYQSFVQGFNAATPAMVLCQVGLVGAATAGVWGGGLFRRGGASPGVWGVWMVVLAGALLGAAAGLWPETTYDKDAGRWTGYWNAVKATPVLFGRTSVLVLAGSTVGGAVLAGLVWGAGGLRRWVLLAGFLGFVAAVSANVNAWPRYHEPMVLVWVWVAAGVAAGAAGERDRGGGGGAGGRGRWWGVVGPAVLGVVLAGVTARELWTGKRAVLHEQHEAIAQPLRELWPASWREAGGPAGGRGRLGAEVGVGVE